jgi:hypothetical protein
MERCWKRKEMFNLLKTSDHNISWFSEKNDCLRTKRIRERLKFLIFNLVFLCYPRNHNQLLRLNALKGRNSCTNVLPNAWAFSHSDSEIIISRVDFLDKLMTHGPRGWLNETNRCSNVVAETIFHGRPYCASNLLNKYYCLSVAEYSTNNCRVSNWVEQSLMIKKFGEKGAFQKCNDKVLSWKAMKKFWYSAA